MKKILKSCLALLLSICLVFGMTSVIPASANEETPQYMIHYKHNDKNRGVLGQDIVFEKDTTYTLSFSYSMVTGEYNTSTIAVDQETFEAGIREFDTNSLKVEWISE